MNYQETLDWLFQQFPAYHELGAAAYNPGLKNTEELSAFFGHPEKQLTFIHVGGTNGKGSVSNMLASILTEAYEKVGLFTSPHLFDFTERIRVNGATVSEEFVIEFCAKIRSHNWTIAPSFFEITWVMALCYFEREKCSIVVAEVGLGGRLDATNIITPILSIITNIGLDHVNLLGNTRAEIAGEKAGIIKPGIPVIFGEKDKETAPIFDQKTQEVGAVEINLNTPISYPVEIIGYQKGNFAIVHTTCAYLETIGYQTTVANQQKGITHLKVNTGFTGRMEVVGDSPRIILDCAHNAEGIVALFSALDSSEGKLHCIYGTSSDKDLEAIKSKFPKDAAYYFTEFKNPRSAKLSELKHNFGEFTKKEYFFSNPLDALKQAQDSANKADTILIFGSFFLVHDFFETFFKKPLAVMK